MQGLFDLFSFLLQLYLLVGFITWVILLIRHTFESGLLGTHVAITLVIFVILFWPFFPPYEKLKK